MSLHPVSPVDDPLGKSARQWLSAAVDGDEQALDKACLAWRDDPQARADWHAFHLIGDVMRSSELAAPAAHDAAFLAGLRQKLAVEPVVLAPQRVAAQPAARNWRVPAAVAAGFVAVAGVLVVSQMSAPADEASAPALALSAPAAGAVPGGAPEAAPRAVVLRDPRLDEFLRAHQSAKGGIAVAVPGSSLRRVDVELATGSSR
jgi:sigma-E factor negative regulatory protein RseA